jgi:hypothetical protein
MTDLHLRSRRDLIEMTLEQQLAKAEDAMDEAFPDRLRDRELIALSYKLPMPLALALLRRRLIRGLALRGMYGVAHREL